MNILLVEDEIGLSDALSQTLKTHHYLVTAAFDGERGLDEGLTNTYDVIILDVMLPKLDGFHVLKELRANHITTPILMLTAKADLDSRVHGLDSGADYYLTKPFETPELLACIRAISRRDTTTIQNDLPSYGDLTLDLSRGVLLCSSSGKEIKMSAKELHLMELLIKNQGHIVEKETLIERIWGIENNAEYNNIEVYISFVRKKLQFLNSSAIIRATRGIGYSLDSLEVHP